MIPPSIKNRFKQHARTDTYSAIKDVDWADPAWQLNHAVQRQQDLLKPLLNHSNQKINSFFATPYYLNLTTQNHLCPVSGIILNQQALGYLNHQDMLLDDEDFVKNINFASKDQVGIVDIYLPLLTAFPQRITKKLSERLQSNNTVIIHLTVQHPVECTAELFEACAVLADAGFILNNRMTFIKGINDSPEIVKELNLKLLMMRVRPYLIYLHENNEKSELFNVNKSVGIQILDSLRGWTSGLAVPHLIYCDGTSNPHPILPNYIKDNTGDTFVFRNYKNLDFKYINSIE